MRNVNVFNVTQAKQPTSRRPPSLARNLSRALLADVHAAGPGPAIIIVAIVSPRDPQSGLPTGKRM